MEWFFHFLLLHCIKASNTPAPVEILQNSTQFSTSAVILGWVLKKASHLYAILTRSHEPTYLDDYHRSDYSDYAYSYGSGSGSSATLPVDDYDYGASNYESYENTNPDYPANNDDYANDYETSLHFTLVN